MTRSTTAGRTRRILARAHPERMDGVWCRLLDDQIIEVRDPNSGSDPDPASKPRFQYRVAEGTEVIQTRCLPPVSVGDAWRDVGVPEWESTTTPPRDELLRTWWRCVIGEGGDVAES
ncbi:MAG: hypothetical protein U0974_15740 [Gemmatimonadales bacterium]|nr:hypothetical protein [Gemmatimonadales bacterium]